MGNGQSEEAAVGLAPGNENDHNRPIDEPAPDGPPRGNEMIDASPRLLLEREAEGALGESIIYVPNPI